MENSSNLKPCPFCGSNKVFLKSDYTRIVQTDGGYTVYSIQCSNCDIETSRYMNRNQVISKWQNRSKRESVKEIDDDTLSSLKSLIHIFFLK